MSDNCPTKREMAKVILTALWHRRDITDIQAEENWNTDLWQKRLRQQERRYKSDLERFAGDARQIIQRW